jgi:hypothetical protein
MYSYDDRFYEYINRGAIASAKVIVPKLFRMLNIESVADFGCGQGAWLSVWKSQGVAEVVGVDGAYVSRTSLLIDPEEFAERDLKEPVRLNRRFDLVQSLEVAEHLPESNARQFVASLVAHGDVILFSAAAPGQGGEHHVNEQPYQYWRDLFGEHQYLPADCIRTLIDPRDPVEPWYRYNTLLYVRRDALGSVGGELARHLIPAGEPIPDRSPLLYRLRKQIVRALPHTVMTWMAIAKKHLVVAFGNRSRSG